MCGKIITVENKKTRKGKQMKFCKIMAVQKFTHTGQEYGHLQGNKDK
jgi:hypothetical protein